MADDHPSTPLLSPFSATISSPSSLNSLLWSLPDSPTRSKKCNSRPRPMESPGGGQESPKLPSPGVRFFSVFSPPVQRSASPSPPPEDYTIPVKGWSPWELPNGNMNTASGTPRKSEKGPVVYETRRTVTKTVTTTKTYYPEGATPVPFTTAGHPSAGSPSQITRSSTRCETTTSNRGADDCRIPERHAAEDSGTPSRTFQVPLTRGFQRSSAPATPHRNPLPVTPHPTPSVTLCRSDRAQAQPLPYEIVHPSQLTPFTSPKYYVITRGEEVGIFPEWLDVAIRIRNVSHAEQQKFPTWEAAYTAYSKAYYMQVLDPVPVIGGRFDRRSKKFRDSLVVAQEINT